MLLLMSLQSYNVYIFLDFIINQYIFNVILKLTILVSQGMIFISFCRKLGKYLFDIALVIFINCIVVIIHYNRIYYKYGSKTVWLHVRFSK
jgi:hypothetical protein